MKFTSTDQVKKAYQSKMNSNGILERHQTVRESDLDLHKDAINDLLKTEYNTISGFTFSEVMEAVSQVNKNTAKSYAESCKKYESIVSESYIGTTQAQAPFPVLNKGLTMYQYERSVLPYYAHIFDMKGIKALAYYMKINATNTKGDVNSGDLLASPIKQQVQSTNFVGTSQFNITIGTTTSGSETVSGTIPNAPIAPQSLKVSIEGATGHFEDFKVPNIDGTTNLVSVGGTLGTLVVNLLTGVYTLTLPAVATSTGVAVKATYNRDVQAKESKDNIAKVATSLDSVELTARDFAVQTTVNLQQERLSQAIFGLDWDEEINEMLGAIYNKEIGNYILSQIKSAIGANSIDTYDVGASVGGNNNLFNVQFSTTILPKLKTMIAKASGLPGARLSSYAINADLLPIFNSLPKFSELEGIEEDSMGGQALVGVYDKTPVIQAFAPILSKGQAVGLYKSKKKDFLTPAVFGSFILPVIRNVYDQENLSVNVKQLISAGASQVVAPTLASMITFTNIDF